jgi:hypothetical protein
MTTNQPISVDLEHGAFCDSKSASIADVWRYGLNPEYWRHGITINQGLGWSVSEVEATKRLNYIRVRLGKALFGNNFRKRAKFTFLMFKQGSREGFNQHYHVLMAVRGDHNWSDEQIAEAICEIDCNRSKRRWEKDVYVDFDWKNGNRFHSYVAREAAFNADSVLIM